MKLFLKELFCRIQDFSLGVVAFIKDKINTKANSKQQTNLQTNYHYRMTLKL